MLNRCAYTFTECLKFVSFGTTQACLSYDGLYSRLLKVVLSLDLNCRCVRIKLIMYDANRETDL